MAALSNGCETPKQVHADDAVIQDRCFDPVAIVGMGESLLRISCSLC